MITSLILQQYATNNLSKVLAGSIPYLKNLVIPTILLCIYALLKYTIAVGRKSVSWMDLFVELPIDFLCIITTLTITNYVFVGNSDEGLIVGISLLLLTLLIAIGACYVRRYICEKFRSQVRDGHPIIAMISLYAIVLNWVIFILCLSFSLSN